MKRVWIDFYLNGEMVHEDCIDVVPAQIRKGESVLETALRLAIRFMEDNEFDQWDYKPN